jgi:hypothetical protein
LDELVGITPPPRFGAAKDGAYLFCTTLVLPLHQFHAVDVNVEVEVEVEQSDLETVVGCGLLVVTESVGRRCHLPVVRPPVICLFCVGPHVFAFDDMGLKRTFLSRKS